MKKSYAVTVLALLLIGLAGCKGETKVTTSEINLDIVSEEPSENKDIDISEEDSSVASSEEDKNAESIYEFKLNVYFNEDPQFAHEESALGLEWGFDFAGGEYTTSDVDGVTMYYDKDMNVIASIGKDNDTYLVQVYNNDVSFNIYAETGMYNECIDLLRAEIEKDGEKISYSYEDGCFRSYTGVWLFGIAKIQNGEIGDYDASWAQAEFLV